MAWYHFLNEDLLIESLEQAQASVINRATKLVKGWTFQNKKEDYDYSKNYRYCTVLLKDSPIDSMYFTINSDILDPEKRYHFALNGNYTPNNNLRDICCTVNINSKFIKIYFVDLN